MKIQKVKFKNYRNVPDMQKELNGSNIILLAENTFGKSNFIKAVKAALAGTVGKDAIKHGEKKSEVEVLMADFNQEGEKIDGTDYTFLLKIRKDKHGDEVVSLEVTMPNGQVETKKTMIGSIAGEVELDFNFVELSRTIAGKKRQLEIVKSYLDTETKESLGIWESKAQKAYDDRTDVGRDVKTLEGFVSGLGMTSQDVEKYQKQIDLTTINKEISAASTTNTKINGFSEKVQALKDRNKEIPGLITKSKSAIEVLEKQLEEAEYNLRQLMAEEVGNKEKIASGEEWLGKNKAVSIDALQKELSDATEHNTKYEKVLTYNKKFKELSQSKDEYERLTIVYETEKQTIRDTIREMEFPIKGITFDDNNVYYNGKIVDENNISTAEIMLLECEFKMCKMPNASVVFIERGESLGIDMLHKLQSVAKVRGYQLILENVERGTKELKIELMPEY